MAVPYVTGSEMLAYVKRTLKRDDKDTEVYEAITDTTRDLVRILNGENGLSEYTESTPFASVGDYKITIPTTIGRVVGEIRIIDTDTNDGWMMIRQSKEEFDRIAPNIENDKLNLTGRPNYFCIYDNSIWVYPTADKTTYNLRYNRTIYQVSEIVSATEIPFSNKYRELIKMGVLFRIYRDMGLDNETAKWGLEYEREKIKITDYEMEKLEGSQQVEYRDI